VFDAKIREDIFPFICENPECEERYDLEGFKALLNLRGLVYADCGKFVHQGITCRKCMKTSLKPIPRDNPLVDLRDFIIVPNTNPAANTWEQFIQRERAADEHDFLKFKAIPAWEGETIGYVDIINRYPSDSYALYTTPGIPYLMMIPGDVERKQESENESGEIQLRRLYPDIPKFRNLLVCLSPGRLSRVELLQEEVAPKWSESDSPREIREKKAAWIEILMDTAGDSLREAVRNSLEPHGLADFDDSTFQEALERNLWLFEYDPTEDLARLSTQVGFEETIWQHFKDVVRPVIHPMCTEIALGQDRDAVLGWTNSFEKGKALFIDAPMGLGKAYAIAEGLAENRALSAVIFMPTDRQCREIATNLKISIAQKQGLKYGQFFEYEEGPVQTGLKRDLLEKEVYYVDSINKTECPYYDGLIDGYGRNWAFNQDTCDNCEKRAYCRFISHLERAPLSRIVVATHHEYDQFYKEPAMLRWFKGGLAKEEEAVPRDLFVVDEDLVFTTCYQPVVLDSHQIGTFSEKVIEFLSLHDDGKQALRKVRSLFAQIKKCHETAITPSIDPGFAFPQKVVEDWKKSFHPQPLVLPQVLHHVGEGGDYLEWIEHAIRLGLVVSSEDQSRDKGKKPSQKGLTKAYFPNPAAFDLSRLPPHVFFDAMVPEEGFLEKKLQNVTCLPMATQVKLPWQVRIMQNVNTDLPGQGSRQNELKVKQFVGDLLKELGNDHAYLFITSETVKEGYLLPFLEEGFKELDPVIAQYGDLMGMSNAGDCDVAIVLGDFVPSEAVEIAMALEFIQDKLPKNQLTPTQSKVWTWKEGKDHRAYKDDYAVIAGIAQGLRFSEQRKALALTRYLFHDVDFYVLSKDRVSDYEPFLPKAETDQYRADIFPPKSRRTDSKYDRVKKAVFDWLNDHDVATVTAIHRGTGIRRGTVAEHLKQMEEDRELVRDGKRYTLPS